jgi:hypothetical protein
MTESDGLAEALEGHLRVAVTAAAQVGSAIASAREAERRRVQTRTEKEARELDSRLTAERNAARIQLGHVDQPQWWDHATPEQIAQTYQLARAWSGEDRAALGTEYRIRQELRARYDIDINNTGADPQEVYQAIIRAEQQRQQDESVPQQLSQDVEDEALTEAVILDEAHAVNPDNTEVLTDHPVIDVDQDTNTATSIPVRGSDEWRDTQIAQFRNREVPEEDIEMWLRVTASAVAEPEMVGRASGSVLPDYQPKPGVQVHYQGIER